MLEVSSALAAVLEQVPHQAGRARAHVGVPA